MFYIESVELSALGRGGSRVVLGSAVHSYVLSRPRKAALLLFNLQLLPASQPHSPALDQNFTPVVHDCPIGILG